jgi:hypothetical protein
VHPSTSYPSLHMRIHRQLLLLVLCVTPSFTLHESDVGVVDWHKRLVGVPLTSSISTAPVFHRVEKRQSTKSVVLTATGSNVLAALNPVNGSVGMWDPLRKTLMNDFSSKNGDTFTNLGIVLYYFKSTRMVNIPLFTLLALLTLSLIHSRSFIIWSWRCNLASV